MSQFGLSSPLGFLGLAMFLSLIHSLLEEVYWRWYAFGRLAWDHSLGAAAIAENNTYTAAVAGPGAPAWRTPTTILLPRMFKFSAQFDF